MKTVYIRLEDSVYEELKAMLDAAGQTQQNFYETYTLNVLRERNAPVFNKNTSPIVNADNSKMEAFARLEEFRKNAFNQKYSSAEIQFDTARSEADITRTEVLKALDDMFQQASDVPEMTLDEINAEIADVRATGSSSESDVIL